MHRSNPLVNLKSVFLFLFLITSGITTSAFAQIKTLALGNSITNGDGVQNVQNSYRKTLKQLLSNAGTDLDYVGSLQSGDFDDNVHEGHSGDRSNQLAAKMPNILSGLKPDMTILHIGTNDNSGNNPLPTAESIANIESIVDALFQNNSNMFIILSTLIPQKGKIPETEAINARIWDLAAEKRGSGYLLWVVDQYAAFTSTNTWQTDYMSDDLHPNLAGYDVMANTFSAAILGALANPNPGLVENFERPGPALGSNWDADPAYSIINNQIENTGNNKDFPLATWKSNTNPSEVSIKWGGNADAAGINEAGLALKLDAPSATANGYFVWLSTTNGASINLWEIVGGAPAKSFPEIPYTEAQPTAGDIFTVRMTSDGGGHHFECYVNDVFYGRITDPIKNRGNNAQLYAGIMLKKGLNNGVDFFDFSTSDDQVSPDRVNDLSVELLNGSTASLTWEATGDDGTNGIATSYDVRYSTTNLTEGNFFSAFQAANIPAPKANGTKESMTISGLSPSTTYYFAVKVFDDVGNASSISNVAVETTPEGSSFVDSFERTEIGDDWTVDTEYIITAGDLQNKSDSQDWRLAILNAKADPLEATIEWAATATEAGIDIGGFALLMDAASINANGYLLFRSPTAGNIGLWEIVAGAPNNEIESKSGAAGSPKAGDKMRVVMRKDNGVTYFDLYINGIFDGTVADVQSRQGTGDKHYAGVMLRGDGQNDVASFSIVSEVGEASKILVYSGDGQTGESGQLAAQDLTVLVTDDEGNPKAGEAVKFTVTNGDGITKLPAPYTLRVNVGSEQQYVDTDDNVWNADQDFNNGSYGYRGGRTASNTYPVRKTADDKIYQSQRWGEFEYWVGNLENGNYQVILHFSESQYADPGHRVFDVKLEGDTRLSNFDISKEADGKHIAISREFSVFIDDGTLNIEFVRKDENPMLVGLEVIGEAASRTNGLGLVSQSFQFGNQIGTNTVTVTPEGWVATETAVFNLTNVGGAAATISEFSGNQQSGAAGQQLGAPLVVEVRDINDNLRISSPVQFMVYKGGGTLEVTEPVLTGVDGRASINWTLGNQTAQQVVHAIVDGLSGSPVIFSANATSGIGSSLRIVSGNNQSGKVGDDLPNKLVVQVNDNSNQAVPNYPVSYFVRSGRGSTTKNGMLENTGFEGGIESIDQGDFASGWTAWTNDTQESFSIVPGELTNTKAQRLAPRVNKVANFYSAIKANPLSGAKVQVQVKYKSESTAGPALEVRIRNQEDGAIEKQFPLSSTGGMWKNELIDIEWDLPNSTKELVLSVAGGQVVDVDAVNIAFLTDADGKLETIWSLGDSAMVQEIDAIAFRDGAPFDGSTAKFTATANPGAPDKLVYVDGNEQLGTAGQVLPTPLQLKVVDRLGNGIPNHSVTFEVKQGSATIEGGLKSIAKNTGPDGIASVQLTLGLQIGEANVVTAQASHNGSPLPGSPFNFTSESALPTSLVKSGGGGQSGSATHPLNNQLRVLVQDAQDRAIQGYDVAMEVTQGGGTINGERVISGKTGPTGEMIVTYVLGPEPGAVNKVKASVFANGKHIFGSPLEFVVQAASLSNFELAGGNDQTGTVGTKLSQALKARVVDTANKGIKNWPVTFTVKSGNSKIDDAVGPITKNTDENGVASVALTLGNEPGVNNNIIEAAASFNDSPIPNSPITFQASANVGSPVALRIDSGDKQRGVVGLPVPLPLKVQVVDVLGNGIAGHEVTFEVKTGGGHIGNSKTLKNIITNEQGFASVTHTVGNIAGEDNNVVEARAFSGATPLGGSPALFKSSATNSSARHLLYVSGGAVSGSAGTPLPGQLTVKVTDDSPEKNPVPDHPIIFKVTRGGGKLTVNENTDTEIVATSDSEGLARVVWTLGGLTAPDSQFVEASSTDGKQPLSNSPVKFGALAAVGTTSATASAIEATGPVPADGVSESVVTVKLKDDFGNPIAGHSVVIIVSGNNNISQAIGLSNAEGVIKASFSSTSAGIKTITAVDQIAGVTITNAAEVQFTSLAAENITAANGGGQTRNTGTALAEPLTAKITDKWGNPVAGEVVDFSLKKGDGYFIGSTQVLSDTNGLAKVHFIVGLTPGENKVEARATKLTGSSPVSFSVTGKIGIPAQLVELENTNDQNGVAGEVVANPVGVIVKDAGGDPIYGHDVTFVVTFPGDGDATVNGKTTVTRKTDQSGVAKVVWQLSSSVGPNVLDVTASNLSGAKVIFRAQGLGGAPTRLMRIGSETSIGTVGQPSAQPLQVKVTDPFGNPVEGFLVSFELARGTGFLSSTQQLTNISGIASVNFSYGNDVGERLVRAYGGNLLDSPVNFFLDGRAAGATSVSLYDGDTQVGTIGKTLSRPVRIIAKDGFNNPVQGVVVEFVVTKNNGSFARRKVTTNGRGIAENSWTLGSSAGENSAWAVVTGLKTIEFAADGVTNNVPVFGRIGSLSVNETEKIEFTLRATDADGDPIVYGASNLPGGAIFDSLITQKFVWTPGYEQAGNHDIVFIAQDSKGDKTELLVPLVVNNVNRQPVFSNWQPAANVIQFKDDNAISFSVTAIDPDGDQLSYLWFMNNKHVGTGETYIFPPMDMGTHKLTVKVFDEADTTSQTWSVLTSINLESFAASSVEGSSVNLTWVTSLEVNNAGFNILRSSRENGNYEKINDDLIQPSFDGNYSYYDDNVQPGQQYYYKLEDVSFSGGSGFHGPVLVEVSAPRTFELEQNYPNPFNPTTRISYQIPKASKVLVVIFNTLGQEVARLVNNEKKAAGKYTVLWNARGENGFLLPSGVYYYRISAGKFTASKKMILIK